MNKPRKVVFDSALRGSEHSSSRRRFLRGLAGASFGATSLGVLAACQGRAAGLASKRVPLIGTFWAGSAEGSLINDKAVLEGLEALGYREGQTIRIERGYGDGDRSRFPDLARELVGLRPDVIVMNGIPALPFMLSNTSTLPIVVVFPENGAEELIGGGFIKSQSHPRGNVTGLVGSTPMLWSKRLDLLKETVPSAGRVGVLREARVDTKSIESLLASPPAWVREIIPIPASQLSDLEAAFAVAEQNQVEVLAVSARNLVWVSGIAEQTRRHRLPAICDSYLFAPSGGLMSYGADFGALLRRAGRFVDKILKGTSAADLPVELASTFNFVINKATASVDDQETNVAMLTALLHQAGYTSLRGVTDSREAAGAFLDFGPDIVLLDLVMPHLDGFGVMTQLRPLIPNASFLPILVLTAELTPDIRRQALSEGATDFLTKPLDTTEVRLRVRNLLQTRLLHLDLQDQNARLEARVKERTQALEARGAELEEARGQILTLYQELAHRNHELHQIVDRLPPVSSEGPRPDAQAAQRSHLAAAVDQLTPREQEVLGLVARGQTNAEIALGLVVSPGTIKTHVEHIIAKLGVADRTQAAVRAVEAGILAEWRG